jgi:hypothetical protein
MSKIFLAATALVKGKTSAFSKDQRIDASTAVLYGIITRNGRRIDFPPYEPWMSKLVESAASKHATNVENHLSLNVSGFCKRLFRAAIVVDIPDSHLSQGARLRQTAAAAYKALSEGISFSEALLSFKRLRESNPQVLDVAYVQSLVTEVAPLFALSMETNDEFAFWHKIRLFAHVLGRIEPLADEIRRHNSMEETIVKMKAGKLVFDLLPVTKLRAKYVDINETSLKALVEAVARDPTSKYAVQYEDLDNTFFKDVLTSYNDEPDKKLRARLLFSRCFDIRRFERSGWVFQGSILTDAIHCSVTIEREKTLKELDIDRLSKIVSNARWEHKESNKARKSSGEKKKTWTAIPEEAELEKLMTAFSEGELRRASDILGFGVDENGTWSINCC